MSPTNDNLQPFLLQLQQEVRDLEKLEREDIKDIRNAHEKVRGEASIVFASKDGLETVRTTLVKEIERVSKAFEDYKQAQEQEKQARLTQRKDARMHWFTIVTGIIFVLGCIIGAVLGILNYLGAHVVWH